MTSFSSLRIVGMTTRSIPPCSSRRNAVIGPPTARCESSAFAGALGLLSPRGRRRALRSRPLRFGLLLRPTMHRDLAPASGRPFHGASRPSRRIPPRSGPPTRSSGLFRPFPVRGPILCPIFRRALPISARTFCRHSARENARHRFAGTPLLPRWHAANRSQAPPNERSQARVSHLNSLGCSPERIIPKSEFRISKISFTSERSRPATLDR